MILNQAQEPLFKFTFFFCYVSASVFFPLSLLSDYDRHLHSDAVLPKNCACASPSRSFARKCRGWQVALHVNQPLLTARGE